MSAYSGHGQIELGSDEGVPKDFGCDFVDARNASGDLPGSQGRRGGRGCRPRGEDGNHCGDDEMRVQLQVMNFSALNRQRNNRMLTSAAVLGPIGLRWCGAESLRDPPGVILYPFPGTQCHGEFF